MNPARQISERGSWRELQQALGGSFSAHARGLLANELVLRKSDVPFGRLRLRGLRGAEFTAGGLAATIERASGGEYRMSGDAGLEITAAPVASSADELEIRHGTNRYEARISFLRNTAVVHTAAGTVAARLAGNVTGRRYELVLNDAVPYAALPMAILLLYHLSALRRRVYLA